MLLQHLDFSIAEQIKDYIILGIQASLVEKAYQIIVYLFLMLWQPAQIFFKNNFVMVGC